QGPFQTCTGEDPVAVAVDLYNNGTVVINEAGCEIAWFDSTQTYISSSYGPVTSINGVNQLSVALATQVTVSAEDVSPSNAAFYAVRWGDYDSAGVATGRIINGDNIRASGNLMFAVSAFGGIDSVNNAYDAGMEINTVPGLTSTFSVEDPWGDSILAGFDALGNVTGQTLAASVDILLAGQSITTQLFQSTPQGTIAYTAINDTALPTAAVSVATWVEELDVEVQNRTYDITLSGMYLSGDSGDNVHVSVYYTTDGTQPTGSSSVLMHTFLHFPSTGDFQLPDARRIWRPGAAVLLRMRVLLSMSAGSAAIIGGSPSADNFALVVNDIGPSIANTGSYQFTGSASGGTRNYTTSYLCNYSHTYEGSDGHQPNALMNNNGTPTQGGDYADTYNGHCKSWLRFPNATIQSDLSGATINWVKLRLHNQHSWYNSGMTVAVGWDTKSSFGSTAADPTPSNIVSYHINEGSTLTYEIDSTGASFGAAFQNNAANLVLWAALSTGLAYYGYFDGPNGGTPPELIINYTK
ncbi:MAG: hypothetical protein ACYCOU_14745, partial [Sulfobacillus sp.]